LPKFLAIAAQMGIQERQGLEIIPHLSARELAEVIVQRPLTVLDAADLIKAIAQAIVSESAKAEHLTESQITEQRFNYIITLLQLFADFRRSWLSLGLEL
jgi:hypothetical protein